MPEPTPGAPGTPTPGTATPSPGTDGSPTTQDFLTKAEFGRSAAMIRGLDESLKAMQGGMLTLDTLAQVGLLEVEEADGKKTYKPKGVTAQTPPKPRADDDPLVQRLKTLESQLEKARKEKETSDQLIADQSRDAAIIGALREANAVNPERDFTHLKTKVLKGDKGYFAKGTDEAGYEVEVMLPDLAKEFLKANPELRKAASQGGSGSPGNTGAPGPGGTTLKPGQQIIPKSQWIDMEFFMANKAKFDNGTYLRGQ